MSQGVPKKTRQKLHKRQPSASEYESDALNHIQNHAPPPQRTNTELNLSVIRRYNPMIRNILAIAANAVTYVFNPTEQAWEKAGIEGTMFVCDQTDDNFCVFVINRHGLNNLILDLRNVEDVENTSELLILRMNEAEDSKTLGIWTHEDEEGTRDINAGVILQSWKTVQEAKEAAAEAAPAVRVGQSINLQDIFNRPKAG